MQSACLSGGTNNKSTLAWGALFQAKKMSFIKNCANVNFLVQFGNFFRFNTCLSLDERWKKTATKNDWFLESRKHELKDCENCLNTSCSLHFVLSKHCKYRCFLAGLLRQFKKKTYAWCILSPLSKNVVTNCVFYAFAQKQCEPPCFTPYSIFLQTRKNPAKCVFFWT